MRRPHIARPVYELLPWLYGIGGLALLGLSYFRAHGWLSAALAIPGLAGLVWGLMIGLRRRDFRAMRDEYGGDSVPRPDQD